MSKRYCQSCGMPLRFDMEEWLETNLDGSKMLLLSERREIYSRRVDARND